MNSYYTRESLTMIVKCWNCHTEIEVVSSARDSNKQHKLSAAHIEELLLANMFDGHGGGIVSMRVDDLVYEVAQLIAEEL
jgi:hypothetical protein